MLSSRYQGHLHDSVRDLSVDYSHVSLDERAVPSVANRLLLKQLVAMDVPKVSMVRCDQILLELGFLRRQELDSSLARACQVISIGKIEAFLEVLFQLLDVLGDRVDDVDLQSKD